MRKRILFTREPIILDEDALQKAAKLIVRYRGWNYSTPLTLDDGEKNKLEFWQAYRDDGEHILVYVNTAAYGKTLVYEFHAITNKVVRYRPENEFKWETRIYEIAKEVEEKLAANKAAKAEQERQKKEEEKDLKKTNNTPF